MTFEDRVRDAMQARVERVDAPVMASRPERPRRVWPAVTVGFAIVVVVALVVALIANGSSDDAVSPAAPSYPSRIVAVTYDGRLQVLDSRTGRVIRTLARDAEANNGDAGVSVTPDGKRVYYTRITGATCDSNLDGKQDPITEIASVPVAGGKVRTEASNVRWPAVSPDGRYLAYSGIPNCSDAGQSIVLKALVPDVPNRRFDSVNVPAGTPGTVSDLAWAPDSQHLKFRWSVLGTYPWVLDTATAKSVDDAHRVDIGDGSRVDGSLGDTGLLLAMSAQASPSLHQDVISVDPETGDRVRTLFEIPDPCCGATSASDATGSHVLVAGAHLYRWTVGEPQPTRIGSKIVAATWIPGSGGRRVSERAPRKLVAAVSNGRLIVASAKDGHMLRLLASDYGGSGFAVSPDGSTVYYARRTDRWCNNPAGDQSFDIVAVSATGGAPQLVASDALNPVLSPDGTKLAYSGVPNCSLAADAVTIAYTADLSATSTWTSGGDGSAGAVSPWSLVWFDNRQLVFSLAAEGRSRVLDTERSSVLTAAPALPDGVPAVGCCRVAGGKVISSPAGEAIWSYDAATGKPIRRIACCGNPVDVDPSGRHLLVSFTDPTHPPVMYRSTVGARKLVRIASFLNDARWLPGT